MTSPMNRRSASATSQRSPSPTSQTEQPVYTPASTPSDSHNRQPALPASISFREAQPTNETMAEVAQADNAAPVGDHQEAVEPQPSHEETQRVADAATPKPKSSRCKSKHTKSKDQKNSKKAKKQSRDKLADESSSDSDSSTDDDETSSTSPDSSSEEEKKSKKSKKAKKLASSQKKLSKDKKHRKLKKTESSDESDCSSSDESESEHESSKRKKSAKSKDKKKKKAKKPESDDDELSTGSSSEDSDDKRSKRKRKNHSKKSKKIDKSESEDESSESGDESPEINVSNLSLKDKRTLKRLMRKSKISKSKKGKSSKKADANSDYKRVDQLWDNTIHNYKLKESAEDDDSEFAEYAFLVRRRFDWENKYLHTVVDIKSKQLRAALQDVMKDCKSVSLEAEEPTIDPNILFLYLEALRTHYKRTLKRKIKETKKKREVKRLETQKSLVKSLVEYIDEDYADTKKTLYPLLEAGNITFDLLWALFGPNELAVTSTYGAWDEPRCFKVEYANKLCNISRGEWYCIEGKYLEYDGKHFGFGDFEIDIESFKGPRKITSLATYPLKYHKNVDAVKKQIIERGKRFVQTEGMNYRFHKGLAFMKKKKQVLKININGRIMIDPAIFRRINPNYPVSFIKPKESEELFSDDDEDSDCDCCCGSDGEDLVGGLETIDKKEDDEPKFKYKMVENGDGDHEIVEVEVDGDGEPVRKQTLDGRDEKFTEKREFTEEELLLTSSVILGFAFSEKLWLEFTLSGVHEIEWNEDAFESLVLPTDKKSVVKALVESHKFNAARTIDDVVQGKGKGLVSVLHGPPGTGKTLTAEGISELLRCPLYMVSAGELGTDPARLEQELQKILDIAHSWGAVLLLDEADVFLEKREVHDIHRNALVSIFLRLLEYFQGILFLTTNRVDTFDDAFQSRIHLPLKYAQLTPKARKQVWKQFIDLCRQKDAAEVAAITDQNLEDLSRKELNGRQIKNVVRTAQALALNEKAKLDMSAIKRVLEVSEDFDRDLKGGTGYLDAMRSYT
ncbi:hypothetical protein K431DRAFT_283425 [Polychaeton citri CBS 116435]|uniref:AAA+ ATPase domain-containing protein n=1 Tax=Polychaeton citri CBS 116435 TaxID=1314669 RepID=A0A9P4QDF5_9PEZI|nr:hypothetical protein K431DRAFT_283425 [Polychaeton citri CBS 116435]